MLTSARPCAPRVRPPAPPGLLRASPSHPHADDGEQGLAVLLPCFFATHFPRQFQRDHRDLPVDAGPTSEAAGGWVADVALGFVAVQTAHHFGDFFGGAIIFV